MKKLFSFVFVAFVMVVLVCACGKDKRCRCEATVIDEHRTISTENTTLYFDVDGSVKCEDITTAGDQWFSQGGFDQSENTISCTEE